MLFSFFHLHRHQREQSSLIKTFSQASFAQVASATNIPALSHNNHMTNNHSFASNASYSRSLSVPNDSSSNHKMTNHQSSDLSHHSSKKEKKKKQQQSVGDPGKLEFVKTDVDNSLVCPFLLCTHS